MAIRIKSRKGPRNAGYLDGQLLIAMPGMADQRFARSVIYLCAHSEEGAMGLIINQRADHIEFPELLVQLDILRASDLDDLPVELDHMTVHIGGPVETGRGFVLHSNDYFTKDSTLVIDEVVSLTATVDILRAIAEGEGPEQAILALGYAKWTAGQLEAEIQTNAWLNCPADADLIFEPRLEHKYDQALFKIGVDPSHLVSEAGHA